MSPRLADLFVHRFDADLRRRGREAFDADAVTLVECEDGFALAEVKDDDEIRDVGLRWSSDAANVSAACTCDTFKKTKACEHLWAVLLSADRSLSGEAELGGSTTARGAARRAGRGRDEDWKRRVSELHGLVASSRRDPWTHTNVAARRIVYVADPRESDSRGELCLKLFAQNRLKSGSWGVRRPFDVTRSELEALDDPLDKLVLSSMRADQSSATPSATRPGTRELRLNAAQRELLLPRLCASGRLYLESTSREETEPIAFDSGTPWTPVFALERDEQRHEVRLDAALVRRSAPEGDAASAQQGPRADRMALEEPAMLFADGWVFARGTLARFDARGSIELLLELREEGPIEAPIEVHGELEASLLEAPGGAAIETSGASIHAAATSARVDGSRSAGAPIGSEEGAALGADRSRASVAVEVAPPPEPESAGTSTLAAPGVVEDIVPRPSLFVLAPRAGTEEELDCRIRFDYDGVGVDCADARGLVKRFAGPEFALGARPTLIRRNFALESARLEEFLAVGGVPERENAEARDGRIDARDLPVVVSELLARGWNVDAQGKRYRSAGAVKLVVKSGIDWFDLEGGIDFDGQIAAMPALLAAAKRGANTVSLGDGSVGVLPEDWLSRWGLLEVSGDLKGERVRFKQSQGWLLDALLAERGEIGVDAGFVRWRERLASFRGVESRPEPAGFQGELRPYQREGLGWFAFLRELGFGGCLADDMGLGKTVQVLALLEERRLAGASKKPTLVVAPKSLTFNWRAEARRFTPELRTLDYSGIDRTKLARRIDEHDVIVTTYGTLRQDAAFFKDVEFDYAILDEGQAIKNPASQVAKAAKLLRADHRLILTGTPVENHLGELWSLFEFLNPGMLGRSSVFRSLFTGRAELAIDTERRQLLSRSLRPFFLRRTKEQVLDDLPEKSEQIIWCDLDEKERVEYDGLAQHFRATLLAGATQADELEGQTKFHVLEALLRLRQAACHPGLIDKSRVNEDGAKLDVLLPLLDEIVDSEHKALVFSQFTSFLSILRKKLDAAGFEYAYLDGQTRDREGAVERFQTDPKCKLFLISLKAGGFGLNLTAADYVFLLDPWWNPASESQAIDRAHRIGQTRNVMAYRLIARDTVEERVVELQGKKRDLADAILSEDNAVLRDLTRADLEQLLS